MKTGRSLDAAAAGFASTRPSPPAPAPRRLKPRRLRKGDLASLVAPSGSTSGPDRVEASVRALESLGLRVKASPHCADVYGYLAGDDATRARELESAFLDPETAAVICLRGGYGTPRILDRIDYSIVAAHPKVFLGYSDITALHAAFRRFAGLVTFHGPMPSSDMVPELDPESRASLEAVLFGDAGSQSAGAPWIIGAPRSSGAPRITSAPRPDSVLRPGPVRILNPGGRPFTNLSGGIAEGELVGGNLSLIAAAMGTPWELDAAGKILFIEDIDEAPYRIDRMLNHLRLAGVFDRCAGVLIGSWTRCDPPAGKASLTIEEIFRDLILPCGKPVLAGIAAGHGSPNLTLPLGIAYRLDADAPSLEMLESPYVD